MASWNLWTLAVKGKNGLGHAHTLLLRAQKSRCDIVGLQEVRRGGQGSFEAAGYTVYFSGSEKGGKHGVGLDVAMRIVEASGTCTPEPINERLLKVPLSLTGVPARRHQIYEGSNTAHWLTALIHNLELIILRRTSVDDLGNARALSLIHI